MGVVSIGSVLVKEISMAEDWLGHRYEMRFEFSGYTVHGKRYVFINANEYKVIYNSKDSTIILESK